MSRSIESRFYKRKAWLKVRDAYKESVFGLCERCGNVGEIVHHKIPLNANNVNNPKIAYGFSNLELLCLECHNKEHYSKSRTVKGLRFNEDGDLVKEECNG